MTSPDRSPVHSGALGLGHPFSPPILRCSRSLQVEPQQETCLYEELYSGQAVEGMAMVYRGGKLDIRLRVEDPNKRILYDQLLFSNIDDATGAMLNTIVRKVRY